MQAGENEKGKSNTAATKKYLEQAYYLDKRIDTKISQILMLRSLSTKVTSVLTDMPGSPIPDNSKTNDVIDQIVDLENEVAEEVFKLVAFKREIGKMISEVDNPLYREVLEKRYLNFDPWWGIANDLGKKVRNIYKIHDRAIEKINICGD